MIKATCGDCRFFRVNPQDLNSGACHFYPPKSEFLPVGNKIQQVSHRPSVQRDDLGCGEFVEAHGVNGRASLVDLRG